MLSPAMRLLLSCCTSDAPFCGSQRGREAIAGFSDWEVFTRLAVKNRVYPMVYRNLSKLDDTAFDPGAMNTLRAKCGKNRLDSLMLVAELINVANLFERAGIKAISIKGPALGFSLYGDPSLRTSRDLDLLVDQRDFDAAERILFEAGYSGDVLMKGLTPKQRKHLMKTSHHFSYVGKNRVTVELHWRLQESPFCFGFEELWEGSVPLMLFGKKVYVLREEENFLYLVFHGSRHAWKRLRWLCHVNELVTKGRLDWAYIAAKAQRYGTTRMVGHTFILLERFFGTEPPEGMRAPRASDPRAIALAEMALPFIASADETCESPGHHLYWDYKRYMFEWQDGRKAKMRFILNHFQPSCLEFQAVRIRDSFFFLYYLIRPFLKLRRMATSRRARQSHENAD